MVSKAIQLAKECGIYGGKVINMDEQEDYWVEDISMPTIERFYARAQAQALREAADKFAGTTAEWTLRRMAEALERKA